MDLGSFLLILAVLVLVGIFISQPFFTRQFSQEPSNYDDHQEIHRSALLSEHERTLSALQELDFDYALGKIPAEDYPAQRSALLQTGASILRQLDSLAEEMPAASPADRLEAMIAQRRADSAGTVIGTQQMPAGTASLDGDDRIEDMIRARRLARQEKAAGFCPCCGKPVQKSDRFCPKCGAKLA